MVDLSFMCPELTLCLRVSGDNCQSSWQTLTSCQVLLPPRLGHTIQVIGSSDTDQVLFQKRLVLPTSTVGRTGHLFWKASSQSPTMVSIVIALGHTAVTICRVLVHQNLTLEWWLYRSPTRNRGLLPRNRASISGANRICCTTLPRESETVGCMTSFVSTIKVLTKVCAHLGPPVVRLLQSIYRLLAIALPVMRSANSFEETRKS